MAFLRRRSTPQDAIATHTQTTHRVHNTYSRCAMRGRGCCRPDGTTMMGRRSRVCVSIFSLWAKIRACVLFLAVLLRARVVLVLCPAAASRTLTMKYIVSLEHVAHMCAEFSCTFMLRCVTENRCLDAARCAMRTCLRGSCAF